MAISAFVNLEFTLDDRSVGAWVARTGASEHDRTWFNLSAGPCLSNAVPFAGPLRSGQLAPDIGVERCWWSGSGCATNLWVGLALDRVQDPGWRAGIVPRIWRTRHDGQPCDVNRVGGSLALSVSGRAALGKVGPGWLTAGATLRGSDVARERSACAGARGGSALNTRRKSVRTGAGRSGSGCAKPGSTRRTRRCSSIARTARNRSA